MPFKDFGLEVFTSSDVNTYLMQQAIIRCTSGTRPGSPTEGWHIYETDTRRTLVYKSGSWVPAFQSEFVLFKNADESYASSTFHSDNTFSFPMQANTLYRLEGYVDYNGSANGFNFRARFTAPSGTTMKYQSQHYVNQGTDGGWTVNKRFFDVSDQINCRTTSVTTDRYPLRIRGVVSTGATTGNLVWEWASLSGTCTVRQLSCMRLRALN